MISTAWMSLAGLLGVVSAARLIRVLVWKRQRKPGRDIYAEALAVKRTGVLLVVLAVGVVVCCALEWIGLGETLSFMGWHVVIAMGVYCLASRFADEVLTRSR